MLYCLHEFEKMKRLQLKEEPLPLESAISPDVWRGAVLTLFRKKCVGGLLECTGGVLHL